MNIIRVYRKDRIVDVIISFDKITQKYCFVNLTDNHICKCRFDSIQDAIDDMNKREEVSYWRKIRLKDA